MNPRSINRWLTVLLIIATATTAILASVVLWDGNSVEMLIPDVKFALPAIAAMLILCLRRHWLRPVGLTCAAALTGKCRWLCVATIIFDLAILVLLVRSWSHQDIAHGAIDINPRETVFVHLNSSYGSVTVSCGSIALHPKNGIKLLTNEFPFPVRSLGAFSFQRKQPPNPVVAQYVVTAQVPHLVLFFLLALPLLYIASRKAYHSAREEGLYCRKCAYNLTGNLSGVCPECGTSISAIT